MTDKVLTLLGFAAKAGRLSYGMQAAVAAVRSGRAKLIVTSGGLSPKSRKEITFYADRDGVPSVILKDHDIQAVSDAVGRKCGILSVNDRSFADAVIAAAASGGNANEQ